MKKYDKSKKKREEYVKIDDYFPRRENIDFNYIIPLKKNEIKLSINSNLSKTKKNKLVSSDDNENKEIYEEGILRPIVDSDEIKNSSSRCFSPKFHIGDILLVSIFDIRKDYMIANYTRNIKVFIHREYSGYSIDKDFNFQNYFNIGQFISVAVISTEKSRNNKKIKCSIEPHIVNAGIDKYHLNEGMDLWGQIKLSKNGLKPYFGFELDEESINEEENENENSEEDENSQFSDNSYSHSLVEEVKKEKIKINNFEFKFSEESLTYLNKRSKSEKDDIIIRPGSYHFFNLKSIEKEKNDKSYKYTLTFDLSELLKTPKYIKNTNKILINNIRPGMLFKITKTQANYVNGAEVLVTQNIFGNIFEDHLIEQSKNILARVIHISHEREKIGLSSKPNIISLGSKETKDKINLIGKEIRLENYEINIHKKLFGESFILNINKKGIIKEEFKAFIHSSQLEKLDNRKKDLSNRKKDKEKADKNLYNEDNVLHCDYYIKEYNFFDDLPFLSPLIKDNDKFEINKEIKSWNDIKIGLKVKGRIVSIHQNFIKVAITPFITGILNKDHLTDNALKIKNLNKYKENSILSLVIFDYNYLTKNLKLTMKPSLEEITTIDNIKIGSQYNFVYSGNNFFMHCGNVIGRLRQFIEIIKFKSFHEGHIYSMIVDKIENNKIYLLDPNPPDTIKMKMIKNEKNNLNNRGIKEIDILKRKNNDQFDYEKDLKIVIDEEDTKKDIIKSNRLNNKSKEEEEEEYQEESEYNEENEELEDNDDEVIDDEDNEIDKSDICEEEEINNDQLKTKVKSSNKREKANLKEELNIRKKEKLIYEREKSNYNPDSIDDFEKKILSNPNSSELWIAYAAFILENINFESSKKIFERAIKTIDISLLKDKLNIWVAYLNLENSFGTKECFSKLVQRALEVNDKKLIYKHIIMIYKNSKTFELVYGIYKIATKQFSNDMSLWKGLLDFTFETNEKFCQIKEVMSSAMQVLISKLKKLEFLLFYSNLLYKYDRIEEGKTAFENLIKDNPKRGDIILVYLDKEIIYNKSLSNIRGIFRRFIDKTLKIKVLKPIIQKYIEWENKNGSQNEKQKANEYVRSIISERTKEIEEKEEKEGQNESEEEI